jgi:hypothetical protein
VALYRLRHRRWRRRRYRAPWLPAGPATSGQLSSLTGYAITICIRAAMVLVPFIRAKVILVRYAITIGQGNPELRQPLCRKGQASSLSGMPSPSVWAAVELTRPFTSVGKGRPCPACHRHHGQGNPELCQSGIHQAKVFVRYAIAISVYPLVCQRRYAGPC